MRTTIAFKHQRHSLAVEQQIEKKTELLSKYFGSRVHAKWTCEHQNGQYHAGLLMSGATSDFHVTAYANNLFKCFDLCIDKMKRQLERRKHQLNNKLHHNRNRYPLKFDTILEIY